MKRLFPIALLLLSLSIGFSSPLSAMSSTDNHDTCFDCDSTIKKEGVIIEVDEEETFDWDAYEAYLDSISQIIIYADSLFNKREFDKAMPVYRELAENEDSNEGYYGWLRCMYYKDDFAGVVDLYDKNGDEICMYAPSTFSYYSSALVSLGKYEEAYAVVDHLLGSYEMTGLAFAILTTEDFPKEFIRKALDEIDLAIAEADDVDIETAEKEYHMLPTTYLYQLSGELNMLLGDVAKAVETYEKGREQAINDYPDDESEVSWFDVCIADAYVTVQDYDNVIKYSSRAVSTWPEGEINTNQLAYAYRDIGEFDKALQVLSEYPETLFGSYRMWLYKGIVNVYARRYEDAVDCLYQYTDESSDAHALRFLAYALTKCGRGDEARSLILETDLLSDYDLNNPVDDAAKLFYLIGDENKAREIVEYIISNYGNSINYHYAAQLYSMMGDTDKALEYLERAYDGDWNYVMQDLQDPELEAIRNKSKFKKILKNKLKEINPALLKKVKI